MKIGAAYIRVSTDDQLELSPDSQIKRIQEYAKSNDIILPEEFIFMEDDGKSGRNASKRPEFQRMIGTAKTKPRPFDVILVWKFSRFARNRQDSVVYKSMLRKQLGIDVISITESLGDDKISILVEALIEAMDEYYSINLAEEVIRGMSEKASRGGVVGSPAFGYLARNGTFVPDPEKASIVQMVFEKYANEDMGCFDLATMLNAMGVRTRYGGKMENRTVEYMLRNPVYIGKIRWCSDGKAGRDLSNPNIATYDGHHEPIISEDLFEAAQQRIAESKKRFSKYARERKNYEYMLKGLVRCSRCGSTMIRSNLGLQCHSYSKGSCNVSHYIAMDQINDRVIAVIESDFQSGNFEIAVAQNKREYSSSTLISTQIERELQKLDRVKTAYEIGVDSIEEYKANKTKILNTINTLKSQESTPQKSASQIKKEFLEKHKDAVNILRNPEVSNTEKNQLLRGFIDHILFDRTKNHIQLFYST